jgi:uncharacterized membrane protein (DUF485 family)
VINNEARIKYGQIQRRALDRLCFSNLQVQCIKFTLINCILFLHLYFWLCIMFFLFKWLCWMVTLLLAVGLERITPKNIHVNKVNEYPT